MAKRVKRTPSLPNVTADVRGSVSQLNRVLYQDGVEQNYRLNLAFPKDGTEPFEAPLPLQSVVTGSLPAAASYEGNIIYDTTTNRLLYSNGTAWISVLGASNISVVVQTFTASDTYTPTPGMAYCLIEVQAAGGGGGGADGAGVAGEGTCAGSGGGGEYAKGRFTASDVGSSQTVTIGAVGAAGNNTGGNGGNGSTSSVGSLIAAVGGSGGTGTGSNLAAPSNFAGGAGGTGGTGGFLRISGGSGNPSEYITDGATFATLRAGKGGDSFLGRGASAVLFNDSTAVAGVAGGNYGGGGRGGQSANTTGQVGGAGGPGIIIVTEFVLT